MISLSIIIILEYILLKKLQNSVGTMAQCN